MRAHAVDSKSAVAAVGSALDHYARRGVLRACGLRATDAARDRHIFEFVWFHNRRFELLALPTDSEIRVPVLLPDVPPVSAMYAELRRFVKARQSLALPEHRRIARERCHLHCRNRRGNVELSIASLDGDFDYAARALVHVINEVFLVFLRAGDYRPYMSRVWELDPDTDQF